MTLTDTLVPTYHHMLTALSAWLGKAADQMPQDKADALMQARLAEDMFPLFTQVCFSCAQAHEGIARLRQEDLSPSITALLDKGRNAGTGSATIAEAQAMIAETLRIVEAGAADAPDLDPDTAVAHTLPNGMVFDLTAAQYVRDWALPQLYFHVMAAYAILRAQGVAIGKVDFVAHMFAFIRPGTMPKPG